MMTVIDTPSRKRPAATRKSATHGRYEVHACTFFLSDFVSIENKGLKIQLPKLKVASSSSSPAPIPKQVLIAKFSTQEKVSPPAPKPFTRNYQSLLIS